MDTNKRLVENNNISKNEYFVDASWVKKTIEQKENNVVILEVTRGAGDYKLDETRTEEDYENGHIPGAVHMSTDELGEFKRNFLPEEQLLNAFLDKGVTKDTTLILYSIYAPDIMYIASRVAFAAYYLGIDHIKILDGGFQAWERAGYPLEAGINKNETADRFGEIIPARPEILISKPDDLIKAKENNPDLLLTCIRSWKEYIGKTQGHHWNAGAGQIPGAIYAGDDEVLTNDKGEMLNPEEYLKDWEKRGITGEEQLVLYCGTSWRASTAFFLMKQLGWENVQLFDGSWYQWKKYHDENPEKYPIQLGDPNDKDHFSIISS